MTNEPSRHIEIENLIVGHFDGTLDEEQEKELATALAQCRFLWRKTSRRPFLAQDLRCW